MSLSAVTSPIRNSFPTTSTASDPYDHEISLQDTTTSSPRNQSSSPTRSGGASTELARAATADHSARSVLFSKSGLKDEFTRRKYARFQENRYAEEDKELEADDNSKKNNKRHSKKADAVKKSLDARRGRLLERLHLRSKRAAKAREKESATDILYENQRGFFAFGYPLYSSRTLLNFDPSAWTNGDFQDSPVDIRNAQLPDPSWTWVWKRWYVDMTDDVDEEGWQYSFSFGKRFSWHGTHPWFHSAVRRRRWLRKRVKTTPHHATENKAHEFTQDYFTIHSALRESSRGSSAERTAAHRSSLYGSRLVTSEESESEEEDITNVASLLKEMKKTTIDRKKLDAVRNFVSAGGDELTFLPDAVPEVLSMFMYQNSRRQMLELLENAVHEIEDKKKNKGKEPPRSPGGEVLPPAGPLREEGLRKSIHVVHENIKNVEYYSDIRAMEKQFHEHEDGHPNSSKTTNARNKSKPPGADDASSPTTIGPSDKETTPAKDNSAPDKDPNFDAKLSSQSKPQLNTQDINEEVERVEIKGIPHSAGVDIEPGILRPLGYMKDEDRGRDGEGSGSKEGKGS